LSTDSPEIKALLERVRQGDSEAFEQLFTRHQEELRRAIVLRLDRRVAARIDASDVLQETYLEAIRRLADYLNNQEISFDLWLRWIAREKILGFHRKHLGADKRTVNRELPALPVDSSAQFVGGIVSHGPTPSQSLAAAELAERLRRALEQLDEDERDLILWRHFEYLTNREIAKLLRITEAAANKRYIRALERLRGLLANLGVSGIE